MLNRGVYILLLPNVEIKMDIHENKEFTNQKVKTA